MRLRAFTFAITTLAFLSAALVSSAQTPQTVLPLWPHGTPEPAQTTQPETGSTQTTDSLVNRHLAARLTNVTVPTLSVFPPRGHNNGAAALVFPGGVYRFLAWDNEGLVPCRWLNSLGITCLLVKYRVPEEGFYPENPADLEDAQQAMRLARAHAAQWHIDPTHIGVMGFSAGANLAVLLSTHPDDHHVESTPAASDVNTRISARADFAILVYPAFLDVPPQQVDLNPVYTPNQFTPATFLIQAENDRRYGKNALVYFRALMDAAIPAELHYYARGGHGFGMHPVGAPEENWPLLAATWLRSIHVLPSIPSSNVFSPYTGDTAPCPIQQPPAAGGNPTLTTPTTPPTPIDPNCW